MIYISQFLLTRGRFYRPLASNGRPFWLRYPEFYTHTQQLTDFVDKASLKK
jgi:hypothetical protein